MSISSFLLSTLSIALGIGAVTHAKSQLIEQGLQEAAESKESAHHSSLLGRDGFEPTFYESRHFGDAPNYWSHWTV